MVQSPRDGDGQKDSGQKGNLVTRMLETINVGSGQYDFDEILRRFEEKFGNSSDEDGPSPSKFTSSSLYPEDSSRSIQSSRGPGAPTGFFLSSSSTRSATNRPQSSRSFSSSKHAVIRDLSPHSATFIRNELDTPLSSRSICSLRTIFDGPDPQGLISSGSAYEQKLKEEDLVPVLAVEFNDELCTFFAEFCRMVHASGKLDSNCSFDQKSSLLMTRCANEVPRKILRQEMRSFIEQMPDLGLDTSGRGASGHRTLVMSLKRQVKEKREEVERLLRSAKAREIENRNLRHELDRMIAARDEAISEKRKETEEKERLRARVASLKCMIEDNTHENEHIYFHKQRLERHVGVLRKELLSTHHDRDAVKLEHEMLERRLKELTHRNNEAEKSESIIISKVQELQEIQKEMIETMAEIGGGNNTARKAFQALSLRRTKLVGRIASMMTKKDRSADETDEASSKVDVSSSADGAVPIHAQESGSRTETTIFPAGYSVSGIGSKDPGYSSRNARPMDGIARKLTFNRIFKGVDTGDTENFSDRDQTGAGRHSFFANKSPAQQAIGTISTRAQAAWAKDMTALREVIELKEKELKRMEEELEKAQNRSEAFELELFRAKQYRKKENRNLQGAGLTNALRELAESKKARNPHNTLFEWQSKTPISTPENNARMRKAKSEIEAHFSPLSIPAVDGEDSAADDIEQDDAIEPNEDVPGLSV